MLNRKNIVKLLGIGSLCLFLLGCSEESFLLQGESSTVILEEEIVSVQSEEIMEEDANQVQGQEKQSIVPIENQQVITEIAVHICGAVNQPGVYYLKENQRMHEGIQKAGGFREDADQDYLNQALILEDGMKIIVPTKEETEQIKISNEASGQTGGSSVVNSEIYIQKGDSFAENGEAFIQMGTFSGKNESENTSGKVDLNTADEALLCTLPGIGESRAKSIIDYREKNGPFQKVEDIMKVSGIKEAAFEKIKDYVIVSE